MADSTEFVVKYIGDVTEVKQSLQDLEQINRDLTQTLGSDFAKAVSIINNQLTKIQTGKTFTIIDPETGKKIEEVDGQLRTFVTTVKLADGTFAKFTKDVAVSTEGVILPVTGLNQSVSLLNTTLGQTGAAASRIIAPLTNAKDQFSNLQAINEQFAQSFGKEFVQATKVVEQNIDSISQKKIKFQGEDVIVPVQRIGAVVEQADGKFSQLIKTITTLPDGTQQATFSIKGMAQELEKASIQASLTINRLDELNKVASQKLGKQLNLSEIVSTTKTGVSRSTVLGPDGASQIKEVQDLQIVAKAASGELIKFAASETQVNGAVTGFNATLKDGSTKSRSFAEDIGRLAERAIKTIPIWFAIRGAIQLMFGTFRDGIRDLISFDLELQKVKRNLQGTPEEIGRNFKTLRDEITRTALETGVSTNEIANAVKKFATIGFNFEDSLKGGIEATKLSVVLFGDASDTAGAFARALKLLINTSDKAKTAQEQIAEAFALTAELEKSNQFEIDEVNQSLGKFAATAKTAGLSLKETLILLATLGTAGRTGSQAGTLLSSSVNELRGNLDSLSKQLGIKVNPQFDTTFTLLGKILDKSAELGKSDKLGADLANALSEIFGGERGTKTISSLVALNDVFKKNSAIVADVAKFHQGVNDVLNSESGQAKILGTTLVELKKHFVSLVIGADDFTGALKAINVELQNSKSFTNGLIGTIAGILNTFTSLRTGLSTVALGFIGGLPGLLLGAATNALTNAIADTTKRTQNAIKGTTDDINKALKGELDKIEVEKLIIKIKDPETDIGSLNKDRIIETLQKQIDDKLKNAELTANVKVKAEAAVQAEATRQDIAKLIVSDRLEELKAAGATTSEILKQTDLLNKQFHISETDLQITERKLKTEQAIREEKKLQNKIGSDSLKLFDIAKTEGVDVAKAIGDALQGNIDFDTFIRTGGRAVEVFKKEFGDVFNQQQAQRFFEGLTIPGLENLRGGFSIAIDEESIRKSLSSFDSQAQIQFAKAQDFFENLKTDTQNVNNMTVGTLTLPSGANVPLARTVLPPAGVSAAPTSLPGISTLSPADLDFVNKLTNTIRASGSTAPLEVRLTIDVGGEERLIVGTKEEIARSLAQTALPLISDVLVDRIENNPQSKEAQAINKKIKEF